MWAQRTVAWLEKVEQRLMKIEALGWRITGYLLIALPIVFVISWCLEQMR